MLKKIMTAALMGAVSLSFVAAAQAYDFPATPINHGPYQAGGGITSSAPAPMAEPMAAPMSSERMRKPMARKMMSRKKSRKTRAAMGQ